MAFRDNEIQEGHPFIQTKLAVKKITKVLEINLVSPQAEQMNQLCMDVLYCLNQKDCFELTEVIHAKTRFVFFLVFLTNQY